MPTITEGHIVAGAAGCFSFITVACDARCALALLPACRRVCPESGTLTRRPRVEMEA
jgi:hypothetical protein